MASALARKLLLKPGQRATLFHPPEGFLAALEPLPDGVTVVPADEATDCDFVQLFVQNAAEVRALLPSALRASKNDGVLWIAYPKGGAKAGTDLNRDILWALVGEHGYAGVSLVAIDATWSSMRFRPADLVGR